MKRFIALFVVTLMTCASVRLLVCDYSCFDHARAHESSQLACHEQAQEERGPVLIAGANACDEAPAAIAEFVIGKVTSFAKPALVGPHVVAPSAHTPAVIVGAPAYAPARLPLTPHQTAPLRI
jgi:hypothetical protein